MEKKKRKGKRKRTSSLSSLTQQTAQSPFKKLKVYTLKLLHINPAKCCAKDILHGISPSSLYRPGASRCAGNAELKAAQVSNSQRFAPSCCKDSVFQVRREADRRAPCL